MNETVVITGMGLVTPLGKTVEEVWLRILDKQDAARAWPDLDEQGFRRSVACRVADYEAESPRRGLHMAQHAARQALAQAQVEPIDARPTTARQDGPSNARTGIFVGSTLGESLEIEQVAEGKVADPQPYSSRSFAHGLQQQLHWNGLCRAYGTACAAGNYALRAAADALQAGRIDLALAGGVDPFSRIAMAGFSRSRAMTSDGHCRPFDQQRRGMLLGEGAAMLVLERATDARARGVQPLARIGPAGFTCDAFHPTAPEPEGKGMEAAMRTALQRADLQAQDLSWICAHGTGTRASDRAEAQAIARLGGPEALPVHSTKGGMGHALGAATAIEAVICVQSIIHQIIPPTTNHNTPDPDLRVRILAKPEPAAVHWVLNCGYAFGGLNAALLLGAWT